MYSMQGGMDYLYEALHGTAIRYAAEKRNRVSQSPSFARSPTATTTSWLRRPASRPARGCASPVTRVGHELIAVGMLILAGVGAGRPLDHVELERWSRVGFRRGSAALHGER
jgi:hypothetical protein